MAWVILLGLIALPVIEISLFIKSSQWIGFFPTIILAIAAGAAGLAVLRRQGFSTLLRTRTLLEQGQVPVAEIFDGLCLAVAGAFLILPGFFSDVVALLLLLPPVRTALRGVLGRHVVVQSTSSQPPIIDGDYQVVEDNPPQGPKPLL